MKVDVDLKSRHWNGNVGECVIFGEVHDCSDYILVKRFCLSGQQQGRSHLYSSVLICNKTNFNYSEYISQLLSFGTRLEGKKTGINNERSCSWEFWSQKCLASEENAVASPLLWNQTCWFLLLPPVWGQLKLPRWCRRHMTAMAGPATGPLCKNNDCCTWHAGVMPIGVCLHCFVSNVPLSSRPSFCLRRCAITVS